MLMRNTIEIDHIHQWILNMGNELEKLVPYTFVFSTDAMFNGR